MDRSSVFWLYAWNIGIHHIYNRHFLYRYIYIYNVYVTYILPCIMLNATMKTTEGEARDRDVMEAHESCI